MLVNALKKCRDEAQIENVFEKYHKKEDRVKIRYLGICRGNTHTSFMDAGEDDDLHSRYLTARSMFLTGSWR
jgi:hypothetical protein